MLASRESLATVRGMTVRRRRYAFTFPELIAGITIAGILLMMAAATATPVLKAGKENEPKRTLTTFITAQSQQWDRIGGWYDPADASEVLADVTVVGAGTPSDDAKTVSMATTVDTDGVAFVAGAVQGDGVCFVWRAAQTDSMIEDLKVELPYGSCTGSVAISVLGGSRW